MPREKLVKLSKVMGIELVEPKALARRLAEFESQFGIARSLRELGFDKSRVDEYVTDVLEYRRNIENAIVEVSKDMVKSLIEKLYEGW